MVLFLTLISPTPHTPKKVAYLAAVKACTVILLTICTRQWCAYSALSSVAHWSTLTAVAMEARRKLPRVWVVTHRAAEMARLMPFL